MIERETERKSDSTQGSFEKFGVRDCCVEMMEIIGEFMGSYGCRGHGVWITDSMNVSHEAVVNSKSLNCESRKQVRAQWMLGEVSLEGVYK